MLFATNFLFSLFMPLSYKFLTQEDKDDILTEYLREQEKIHYRESLHIERYDIALQVLPDGDLKDKVQRDKDAAVQRCDYIENVRQAADAARQDPTDATATVARLREIDIEKAKHATR